MKIKTIDGTKKLTIRHFKKFEAELNDNEMMLILVDDVEIGTVLKEDFRSIFISKLLNELEDEQIISLMSENVIFKFTAKDYKKWTNPWWAARIFAKENIQQKSELNLILNCAIYKRKKDTSEIYDKFIFSADKIKEIIDFINKVRGKMHLQSLIENADVIYSFWYGDEADKALTGTFEELQEKGVFAI